jgi:hypothetical protein
MKIGIPLSKNAYTPESYAYYDFLISKGCDVELDYILEPKNDINVYFMVFRPFWKNEKTNGLEVHEYQSLSTPPFAYLKNTLKTRLNSKPNGRIFLNDFVKQELDFTDNVPFITRDMGIDKSFFQKPIKNPEYDITYCGSILGRIGLIDEIIRLGLLGFRVQIIGNIDEKTIEILKKYKNIKIWGRVDRKNIPALYQNSRCGLNFTPDIYPFNMQTSTKVLEYAASNLLILSNRYNWSEKFNKKNSLGMIWLDEVKSYDNFYRNRTPSFDNTHLCKFEWNILLENSGFYDFLLNIVNK